ncbi:phospholipase D-like domain-containing protein DpdK [Terrabacter sp. Root181]|uniref:phospholipase D-like domain-containing protein DpdK n=1 Tax=Terrabacter sp. Root181 TaxID=1736484 RepID=UPI0009EA969D|nr:phospholipase D-like domain-containing protein DpdK [Terrabacter sp. Root181]
MTRLIFTESKGLQAEIRGLLSALLVAELLSPSRELWLISPWVSDIPVIDNRSDAFASLSEEWPTQEIGLARVFVSLAERGTAVRLLTRPDAHNLRFIETTRARAQLRNVGERFQAKTGQVLHEKGLLSSAWYVSGSMNFTRNGILILEEALRFDSDPRVIGEARLAFMNRWTNPEYVAV